MKATLSVMNDIPWSESIDFGIKASILLITFKKKFLEVPLILQGSFYFLIHNYHYIILVLYNSIFWL